MDNQEAQDVLDASLASYRQKPYGELVELQSVKQKTVETTGESGTKYRVEVQIFWDSAPGGDVRVVGNIDDGGIRALMPLSSAFIMAPDGSFVDEGSGGEIRAAEP